MTSECVSACKRWSIFLTPLLCCGLMLLPAPDGLSDAGWRACCMALWMALWWITEAVPLAVTGLLPLLLFPMLNIQPLKDTAPPYASPAMYLFVGGFMIGLAMEKWHLHKRIALNILRLVGTSAPRIVGGFMLATALITMWISNTATTVMMLPIALSVVSLLLEEQPDTSEKDKNRFVSSLMLGVAYAATIGGVATLIGTPTNAIMKGFLSETYGYEINFLEWMLLCTPIAALLGVFCWWLLTQVCFRTNLGNIAGAKELIAREIKELGRMQHGEKVVATVFCACAALWMFQQPLSKIFPFLAPLNDTSIAILGGILLFIIPVDWKKGVFALTWKEAERMPWGILLMFGGGLSLADALGETGVAEWLGHHISVLGAMPLIALVAIAAVVIVLASEMMSNMSVATTFLPIAAAAALGMGENPLLLVIPVTLAASYAFMMPCGTAPNALAFSTGHLKVADMVRVGIWLNIASIALIVVFTFLLGTSIFGIEDGVVPDWAAKK